MDTFEAAFWQMMSYHGLESVAHIDCIGKRCFGFLMGESVKEWFRPAVSLAYAAEQIEALAGIPVAAEVCRQPEEVPALLEMGVVLGPVWSLEAVPEIRHVYYHGGTHYVFVKGNKEGMYCITDPEGFPEFWVYEKEIRTMLQKDCPYVLYLKERDMDRNPYVDLGRVLEEGISFYRQFQEERNSVLDAVDKYQKSSQNRLSLQYGLMNYMLQMDKVFRLAWDCGTVTQKDLQSYQNLKSRIYGIGMEQEVKELPDILNRIWTLVL